MYGVRVILMMIRGRCVRVQASSRLDWLEFDERKEAQEEDSKVKYGRRSRWMDDARKYYNCISVISAMWIPRE